MLHTMSQAPLSILVEFAGGVLSGLSGGGYARNFVNLWPVWDFLVRTAQPSGRHAAPIHCPAPSSSRPICTGGVDKVLAD